LFKTENGVNLAKPLKETGMKSHLSLLLPAVSAIALACIAPANAVVMVLGNELAHDCFLIAKSGTDPVNGIATCTSALENQALSPHDRAGTFVNRGAIKIALGRVDDAMNDYNTGIAILPGLADAYVDRAGAFIMQKKFDEAMTDVNHGIDLGPTYPFVGYYNRAVAEQLTGKLKEAYFDYQKTLELEPKFAPAADRLKDFVVTKAPAGNGAPGG
jgi:tetratricopeptide (TPR) repeat protein